MIRADGHFNSEISNEESVFKVDSNSRLMILYLPLRSKIMYYQQQQSIYQSNGVRNV